MIPPATGLMNEWFSPTLLLPPSSPYGVIIINSTSSHLQSINPTRPNGQAVAWWAYPEPMEISGRQSHPAMTVVKRTMKEKRVRVSYATRFHESLCMAWNKKNTAGGD